MGIMQDIRALLLDGHSSADVINMGYNPNTVYKSKRQLGRGQQSITAQKLRFLESLLGQVMAAQWGSLHNPGGSYNDPDNSDDGFFCPQCNVRLEFFETSESNGLACPECKQTITI